MVWRLLISALIIVGCSGDTQSSKDPDVEDSSAPPLNDSSAPDLGEDPELPPGNTGDDITGDDITNADDSENNADTAPPSIVEESVTLTTADNKSLAAIFYRLSDTPESAPGVLLVHQFNQSKAQWTPYMPALVALGFRVLAIDLRGHGDSDPQDGSFVGILSDPDQAPQDIVAALAWLTTQGKADPSRIAMIGTSIGANLVCVANGLGFGVKIGVSISSRDTAIKTLAADKPLTLSGMFFLATENDGAGAQAGTAQALFEQSGEPRKLDIVPNSAAHGTALLNDFPEKWDDILTFVGEEL
jgi:pimeloyl-ACP methyl ester carboxylesterase